MNNKKLQKITDIVNADIEKINNNLLKQIEIKTKLKKDIENFLKSPSKRIRSLVSLLFIRASKMYLYPAHYELLASVELVHNASLIHDDVIDKSKNRRNRKSINEKFDNNLAVISGDYLIGIALQKLVKINNIEIINIFAKTLQDMCIGEFNQYFNRFIKTDLDTYIEKTTQKTASLFNCALNSCVILAEETYTERMSEFATNFGIAFQIRDDLINTLNSKTDEKDGIYNAPHITDDNIEQGIEKTKILLNNYIDCAKHCINDLDNSIYKTALFELLELIQNV